MSEFRADLDKLSAEARGEMFKQAVRTLRGLRFSVTELMGVDDVGSVTRETCPLCAAMSGSYGSLVRDGFKGANACSASGVKIGRFPLPEQSGARLLLQVVGVCLDLRKGEVRGHLDRPVNKVVAHPDVGMARLAGR
jgi:hypothetical protein